nr:hypothetical protein [Streptomyces sp. DSM 41633]
ISVEDWTVDNLSDRIAEVRQIYLDTLKSWPEDELPVFDVYARATPAKKAAPRRAAKKATAKKAPAKKAAPKPDTSSSRSTPKGRP